MQETLWKNNLDFVKDVPMIYARFITTEVTVSDRERETERRHYFHTAHWCEQILRIKGRKNKALDRNQCRSRTEAVKA